MFTSLFLGVSWWLHVNMSRNSVSDAGTASLGSLCSQSKAPKRPGF
jgi:hypothetical protein